MKKLLFYLAVFFSTLSANSQNLVNTTWLGTNPPSPNLWFRYGTDTLYYSFGTGYSPLSLYTAISGQFSIFDLPGASLCTDTGFYNYSVTGNNLDFTLISDNCSSRRNTLLNYNWILLSTGFSEFISPAGSSCISLIRLRKGSLPLVTPGLQQRPRWNFTLYDLPGKRGLPG